MKTDKYGRKWPCPEMELCPVCGQPDNTGDCDHEKMTPAEAQALGALNYRIVVHKSLKNC